MTASIAAGRTEGFALGLALSAFDAAATWLWLTLGMATEANPVIDQMINAQGLTSAMGMRALFGAVWFGGFYFLSKRSRLARPAQLFTLVLLSALAIYHVSFGATHLASIISLG